MAQCSSSPIFLPIVKSLGMDPIQFGVMIVMNLSIGTITPPVGKYYSLWAAALPGCRWRDDEKSCFRSLCLIVAALKCS